MNHVTKCAEALRERFYINIKLPMASSAIKNATTEEIEDVIRPFILEAFKEGKNDPKF